MDNTRDFLIKRAAKNILSKADVIDVEKPLLALSIKRDAMNILELLNKERPDGR